MEQIKWKNCRICKFISKINRFFIFCYLSSLKIFRKQIKLGSFFVHDFLCRIHFQCKNNKYFLFGGGLPSCCGMYILEFLIRCQGFQDYFSPLDAAVSIVKFFWNFICFNPAFKVHFLPTWTWVQFQILSLWNKIMRNFQNRPHPKNS